MHTGQILWKCLPQDPTLRAWLARNDHVKPCLVTCACKKPRNRMAVRSTIWKWRGKQRTDRQKSEMEAQNVKRSRIWKVEVQNGKCKVNLENGNTKWKLEGWYCDRQVNLENGNKLDWWHLSATAPVRAVKDLSRKANFLFCSYIPFHVADPFVKTILMLLLITLWMLSVVTKLFVNWFHWHSFEQSSTQDLPPSSSGSHWDCSFRSTC